ncbi:predicted protein [Chaetoceros tenuissimus]|uniref:Uncharacterized protein n=1 Tax=Chaetoceros tenuissimus TaxID=426638 RepID=A0AAD3CHA9_9STRA|nr:predicted protein [Chaetoceros tenuissimus]
MSSELKSFSRNSLYSTLDTLTNQKNETKSSSKSLYNFMESLSHEFHSSKSSLGVQNGSNNGGVGLQARHFESKLGQRALTLIKGGIDTSISTNDLVERKNVMSKKEANRNKIIRLHGCKSKTKRKKLQEKTKSLCRDDLKQVRGTVMLSLHHLWKSYIQNLFSSDSSKTDQKTLSSLLGTVEMIGALIKIQRSSNHSLKGKFGFIVGSTANTWRIAMVKKEVSSFDDDEIPKYCNQSSLKVVLIPKQSTTLNLSIPLKNKGTPIEMVLNA